MVATRCHILTRKKYTKFDFGWGCAPDPAGGAYSAPPDLLAGFKESLLLRRGRGGEAEKGLQHQAQMGLNPALAVKHVCKLVYFLEFALLTFFTCSSQWDGIFQTFFVPSCTRQSTYFYFRVNSAYAVVSSI